MSRDRHRDVTRIPRIALTGGVASGKSTVAKLFAALGARLIDTDQVAREIVAPPSTVLDQLTARFGAAILQPDGALNRAALRTQVFADAAARADLNALMHPAIRAEVARQSAALGGPYQLIAVPLLAETGTQDEYDRVVLVDAEPEAQRLRLMARDNIDRAAAQRMLDAQASRDERRAIADDIIENSTDITGLARQIEALHQQYLAMRSP